jgi:adenylosuccinate lyase
MASDALIPLEQDDIDSLVRPADYVGLSPSQVETFLREDVDPLLQSERHLRSEDVAEVRV